MKPIWILAAGLLVACGGARAKPDSAGKQRSCTILVTNDSEANFDGDKLPGGPGVRYVGTIARVAAEKRRVAGRSRGVLLVSAGDVLQGRYMYRTDGDRKRAARDVWRLYEAAGYDLAVLGNHEFDAGPAVVAHAIDGLKTLRFVVSNLAEGKGTALHNPGERLFATTVVRKCGGLRVGFIGLLTPSTRTISKFGDTRFRDPDKPVIPAANAAVAALKKQGVDAIVALSHLGIGKEISLARKVDGLDAVVGGHSHTLLKHAKRVGDVTVVQAGARFSHLGHLVLHAGASGPVDRSRTAWLTRKVDTDMAPDPAIAKRVDELRTHYPAEVVIGQRTKPWRLRGPGRRVYGSNVARAVRRWLQDNKHGVQGTMLNAGGLRTAKTYPAGPVTNLEVRAIHPFRNRAVIVDVDGRTMKTIAEHACTRSHRGRGLRVMISGIKITCDGSRPSIRYKFEGGKQVGVKRPGSRVIELEVGGVEVTPDGKYRIATNDYLARGGSGYYGFTLATRTCPDGSGFAKSQCKTSPTLSDIVEAEVKRGRFDSE